LTFREKIEKPYSSQDEIAEKGKIIEVRNYPTFSLKTTKLKGKTIISAVI